MSEVSDKPVKPEGFQSRARALKMQKKTDHEKLEQIKYDGKLIQMENDLIKSQIHEVQKLKVYDEGTALIMRSQSSTHLPPIRKRGAKEQVEFLKDVRHRDWPMYMNSRAVVNDMHTSKAYNEDLKRKLFREKYDRYMINTNQHCKLAWQKMNFFGLSHGDSIVYDEANKSIMKNSRAAVQEANSLKANKEPVVQTKKAPSKPIEPAQTKPVEPPQSKPVQPPPQNNTTVASPLNVKPDVNQKPAAVNTVVGDNDF